MTGTVYLVGAGPSDGGLFTLKGLELLRKADVIVYDALVGLEVMALIPEKTRKINVGKRSGNHPVPQEEINHILLREAQDGNQVVRLKGGDPFLFGRGGEELEILADHGIPFEVVPGVTSALAAPAYGGIPVTHRNYCSSVHIITAHTNRSPGPNYKALAQMDGTLVFLMGMSSLNEICSNLRNSGMEPSMPAAIIEQGTSARQRRICGTITTLPFLAKEASATAPAVIVIGRVCALAERFAWAEKRPLAGKRILVTRPQARASAMASSLRSYGAEVIELPSITPELIEPNPALDAALKEKYDWLALTSPTGVEMLLEHFKRAKIDIRNLYGVKLAAIGSATAERMKSFGLVVDLVPETYSGAALGKALAAQGGRVLLARAKEGSPELTEALKEAGMEYTDIPLYKTFFAKEDMSWLEDGSIDYITFTSASTVHGFMQRTKGRIHGLAVCIGAATERAAHSYGMETVTAKTASIASMTELILSLPKQARHDIVSKSK